MAIHSGKIGFLEVIVHKIDTDLGSIRIAPMKITDIFPIQWYDFTTGFIAGYSSQYQKAKEERPHRNRFCRAIGK
jgi:hypothetical protein